jgi:hypothetical protein
VVAVSVCVGRFHQATLDGDGHAGHLVLSMVTVVLMFAAMAFGAAAFGLRFHLNTIATIVIAIGLLRTQKESASRHRPDRVAQQPKSA